jgi:hypothetical protein
MPGADGASLPEGWGPMSLGHLGHGPIVTPAAVDFRCDDLVTERLLHAMQLCASVVVRVALPVRGG